MKTLHLTNSWHAASGGVSIFYRALLAASERQGHQMRLVVPSDSNRVEALGRHCRIYHVEASRAPFNPEYRLLLPHKFLLPRSAVRQIVLDERPDLLEVCDKYSLNYLAALTRRGWLPGLDYKPAVIGLSCERMDDNMAAYITGSEAGKIFTRWYMKWLYFPLFDHHITVSQHTADELRQASRGHKKQRGVWVRPMGVDVDRFHPRRRCDGFRRELMRQAGGREDTVFLLYAGRLAVEKNLPLLISTMEMLLSNSDREFRLLVAGDGPVFAEFERECEVRVPGHVALLGHVADRDRLADLFANADVFVHPNPREPFGIAPLEAMASGTPVVAPTTGGVTAYAGVANAWLAEADARAFAAAVRSAIFDVDLRERRLRAARTKAEEHSWPRVAEEFLDLYRELHALATGRKPRPDLAPAFLSTAGNWLGLEV